MLSLNFRKPSPSLTGAGQRGHARAARAEPRQRGIDTRSFYEKLPETNRNICRRRRRRQRTSGQRQLEAQHNRWSRHRLQKPKFNKGGKILKPKFQPKFQTRARRKQHRIRGSAPGRTCQAKAVLPRRISWLPLHAKLVCRILRETETEET